MDNVLFVVIVMYLVFDMGMKIINYVEKKEMEKDTVEYINNVIEYFGDFYDEHKDRIDKILSWD